MKRSLSSRILILSMVLSSPCFGITLKEDGYHVYPGDNIQDALEEAARNSTNKLVKVHSGEYRPQSKRQAMVWFNKSHEGIRLEAVGRVTLTAANPNLTVPQAPGFPAVVNHVIYFGDGISSNTVLRGFRITGANHFVTEKLTKQMEPDSTIHKNLFFYTDGGAIKIFGRSSPSILNVEVVDNYASPCGAGISVQQMGFHQNSVVIENCQFRGNRTQVTGAAIDLLEGSSARIVNCLFVGNASNTGEDIVAKRSGEKPFTNSGVLTIFTNSYAAVRNCTFTGNRNAVDDMGGRSTYINCIFMKNDVATGPKGTEPYELYFPRGAKMSGCFVSGVVLDPFHSVSSSENVLQAPSPRFTPDYVPEAPEYGNAGYRPVLGEAASPARDR